MFNASNSSHPNGTIQNYLWDFNGDGLTDTTGKNATHSYDTSGEYSVKLTVVGDNGEVDTQNKSVTVDDGGTHPSGIPQSLFDEVAGQSGDAEEIDRADIIYMIDAFFGSDDIDGQQVDRSDVVNIIDWFFSN
jgi:PKD repeat protein